MLLASAALFLSAGSAIACPYEELAARAAASSVAVDDTAAVHAAQGAELLGPHSAWATSQAARRALAEGRDWRFTGQIVRTTNDLASDVGAPYRTRSNEPGWILATEILEALVLAGHAEATLELAGRRHKGGDGEFVVVLTSWRVINS
ncbi:MAG: hypothetical protein EXR71_09015 [Myxococcales bacterium]|nr:hypothetical protein [Myxococcales bacterium]